MNTYRIKITHSFVGEKFFQTTGEARRLIYEAILSRTFDQPALARAADEGRLGVAEVEFYVTTPEVMTAIKARQEIAGHVRSLLNTYQKSEADVGTVLRLANKDEPLYNMVTELVPA